jgi:Predicted membrane protein
MTEDLGFCTSCGAELDPKAMYCPACGTPSSTEAAAELYADAMTAVAEIRVFKAALYLAIATIPSLILGIYFLFSADSLAQAAMDILEDTFGHEFIIDNNITEEYLRSTYVTSGYALIGIAALGFLGSVLCYKKKMYWVVLVISMVVLIAGVTTIVGLIVGILALWNIMSSKVAFNQPSV